MHFWVSLTLVGVRLEFAFNGADDRSRIATAREERTKVSRSRFSDFLEPRGRWIVASGRLICNGGLGEGVRGV